MKVMSYVRAKKLFNGWALYWIGTSNEVYPDMRWKSSKQARNYYREN